MVLIRLRTRVTPARGETFIGRMHIPGMITSIMLPLVDSEEVELNKSVVKREN